MKVGKKKGLAHVLKSACSKNQDVFAHFVIKSEWFVLSFCPFWDTLVICASFKIIDTNR
jgi:hypothetical protein